MPENIKASFFVNFFKNKKWTVLNEEHNPLLCLKAMR
jgi:hypothetical protein